jgi:hypothetical protein
LLHGPKPKGWLPGTATWQTERGHYIEISFWVFTGFLLSKIR